MLNSNTWNYLTVYLNSIIGFNLSLFSFSLFLPPLLSVSSTLSVAFLPFPLSLSLFLPSLPSVSSTLSVAFLPFPLSLSHYFFHPYPPFHPPFLLLSFLSPSLSLSLFLPSLLSVSSNLSVVFLSFPLSLSISSILTLCFIKPFCCFPFFPSLSLSFFHSYSLFHPPFLLFSFLSLPFSLFLPSLLSVSSTLCIVGTINWLQMNE